MTSATDNFNLPLYGTGDPANLRDQYNNAMGIVDGELKKSIDSATTALGTANNAVGRLNAMGVTDNDTAGTSKTRWDEASALASTNKNGIAAIEANLNALHANTVSDAQSLHDTIVRNAKGHHMVFVGDSITIGYGLDSPTTQSYPYLLSEQLGMTPHVYAQSGAGFVQSSAIAPYNTLSTLTGQAVSDSSFQHSDVEYVLLMGGINDGYEQADQAAVNATSALQSLKTSFPNAEIYFGVCPTCGVSRQSSKTVSAGLVAQSPNIGALTDAALSLPWVRVIDAWGLLWFHVDATTDGLHPNVNGHKMLASCLLSIIGGGQATQAANTGRSLWDKGGAIRNITTPDDYPTDAYSQARYKYAKTHVTNVKAISLLLYPESPTTLACRPNLSLTFTAKGDASDTPSVFYFPISKLPTFTYLYRPDDFWNKLNYNPTIFISKIIDNRSAALFQTVVQYNYRNNCVEVGIAMPGGQTYDCNTVLPQFDLPMVDYKP